VHRCPRTCLVNINSFGGNNLADGRHLPAGFIHGSSGEYFPSPPAHSLRPRPNLVRIHSWTKLKILHSQFYFLICPKFVQSCAASDETKIVVPYHDIFLLTSQILSAPCMLGQKLKSTVAIISVLMLVMIGSETKKRYRVYICAAEFCVYANVPRFSDLPVRRRAVNTSFVCSCIGLRLVPGIRRSSA